MNLPDTPEQIANAAAYEALPNCDWDGWTDHPCHRKASFKWGDGPRQRYMCANHAASWLWRGYTMERLPGLVNPYPGNDTLWEQTREPEVKA